MSKTKKILTENITRKFIFLFMQIAILFTILKNWSDVALIGLLVMNTYIGILFFKTVEQLNKERLTND